MGDGGESPVLHMPVSPAVMKTVGSARLPASFADAQLEFLEKKHVGNFVLVPPLRGPLYTAESLRSRTGDLAESEAASSSMAWAALSAVSRAR